MQVPLRSCNFICKIRSIRSPFLFTHSRYYSDPFISTVVKAKTGPSGVHRSSKLAVYAILSRSPMHIQGMHHLPSSPLHPLQGFEGLTSHLPAVDFQSPEAHHIVLTFYASLCNKPVAHSQLLHLDNAAE